MAAECYIAPEIPTAIYKFGLTAKLVCLTCSLCSCQPRPLLVLSKLSLCWHVLYWQKGLHLIVARLY